ncbi:NACHT domain-containing protein [Aeromonas veronii]|uniref:NACHT domain-containing protein n=1 Tax=Aeromonas veronii TaxID=654 RepID=UPI002B47FF86|nr:hypothetical protein [Aeromonas veronii]
MKNWKKLEDHVRQIAELKWGKPCSPSHLNGVDYDAVIHLNNEEIIIIEITTNITLEKVRADINKINITRMSYLQQGILCKGFIIMSDEPTLSMIEAASTYRIIICSSKQFEKQFFDFDAYDKCRTSFAFGSAIDSKTGENDTRQFIPVNYVKNNGIHNITISEMVEKVIRGTKVVLTGDYGVGKSRCIKECYDLLKNKIREAGGFPIAINLRDHWSSANSLEILAGHLGNIGLSSSIDNFVRLLNSGTLVLLLDGFDEIGTQIHDFKIENRKAIRKQAVRGVRDLISKTKAGIIITGRPHYFDSDTEMLESLGISSGNGVEILSVPDNFTHDEADKYLKNIGVNVSPPKWLPKKPLVFQVLAELKLDDINKLLRDDIGQYEFWSAFINAACDRESRGVSNSISPKTIRGVLHELAIRSRTSTDFLGRLTPKDINSAYEKVVGTSPDENGRQLLARMCTLGRIGPESPDRQFVDYDIVDILRAEHLVQEISDMSDSYTHQRWKQSLQKTGVIHASIDIENSDLQGQLIGYLNKNSSCINVKMLGEIVSIASLLSKDKIDLQGINLSGTDLPLLNTSNVELNNAIIRQSTVSVIMLNNSKININSNFNLEECIIEKAQGISGADGMPAWIKSSDVITFETLSNANLIKESSLSTQHKVFISIIHKIFFQKGRGRKENALLKGGYGQQYSPALVEQILKLLTKDGFITKIDGDEGYIYKPVRSYTARMEKIKSEMTLSDDRLWRDVGLIKI